MFNLKNKQYLLIYRDGILGIYVRRHFIYWPISTQNIMTPFEHIVAADPEKWYIGGIYQELSRTMHFGYDLMIMIIVSMKYADLIAIWLIWYSQVACFPFDDHNWPPIQLITLFCQSAYSWLKEDIENVVGVHCKAGMARTGLKISSLLLYLKVKFSWSLCQGARIRQNGETFLWSSMLSN